MTVILILGIWAGLALVIWGIFYGSEKRERQARAERLRRAKLRRSNAVWN